MADIARRKTKLERHFNQIRITTIGINYCFLMSLFSLIVPIMLLLSPIFIMFYVVYAIVVSFIMIVGTLFLILLTVNDPDSPLAQVWARIDRIGEILEGIVQFGRIAVPIVGGVAIALSILFLVLVSKGYGRQNKAKDRAVLIVSIILCVIGILSSQLVVFANN